MLELLNGREHFYQWDTNQKVKIDDNEVLVVQYDNGTGDALVCPVYEYEGQRVADVPNIMLQMPIVIKAYAACEDCVRYARAYKVEQRSRPDDYIYTETETVKYSSLLAMIEETKADLDTFISEAAATDELLLEKLEQEQQYTQGLNTRIEALEESGGTGTGGSVSGCECRRQLNIVLKRNGYGITDEFSIPILELLSMTQEEINMLDISVMFDEAYWIVDSCDVGNDCIDIQMSYMYIAGDNNGTLTRYHITIYKDDTKEKGYFITEATAGRYNLYHLPNPQNGGGRQYLVAENNSYKLVDDVGTGGVDEETTESLILTVYDLGGTLEFEESYQGITPLYLLQDGDMNVLMDLTMIVGEVADDKQIMKLYKFATIDLETFDIIFANGYNKPIQWAADGTLSYLGG